MNLPAITALSGLGITAGIAAIAAGWNQARAFMGRLAGLVIVTLELRGDAAVAVRCWLKRQKYTQPHPLFARSFLFYFALQQFIRPKTRTGHVMYEELGERGRIAWDGRVPVWVKIKTSEKGQANVDVVVIRVLRGSIDPDRLAFHISESTDPVHDIEAKQHAENRFSVTRMSGRSSKDFNNNNGIDSQDSGTARKSDVDPEQVGARLIGWTRNDIGENTDEKKPVDRLSLTPEVTAVVDRIRRWYKAKDWYLARQIAWRLGCLFYGIPGTGKTSLAKAIAQELGIPVYLMDISTMDNSEFHEKYRSALTNAPCMVLIEDIDSVFHGRENVAAEKGKGLSFDCLLNTISGVENSDGVLLVVTTNNLHYIEPALGVPQLGSISSRPGRIDCAVELPILDTAGRRKLARRILSDCHESWVEHMVVLGGNDTGAQFEDRCANTALNLYWSENPQRPAPQHLKATT